MLGNGPVRFGRRASEKSCPDRHLASAPPHHAHRTGALLQEPGLVHDQDAVAVAHVLDQPAAYIVADRLSVPHRLAAAAASGAA
jgi:hypothetical protein